MNLSKQQTKILELLSLGWQQKGIALVLHISPRTVSEYAKRATRKLKAQTTAEAVSIFATLRITSNPVRSGADTINLRAEICRLGR